MFHNFSDVYIMYPAEVPDVPGEVGATEVTDEESVGGSCSNPDQMSHEDNEDYEEDPPGILPVEDMDEDEVKVEAHEEDQEEDPTGILPVEDMDENEVKVEAHEEDHDEDSTGLLPVEDIVEDVVKVEAHEEDHEEDGHVGRTKRIRRDRMIVGDKMDDYEYR